MMHVRLQRLASIVKAALFPARCLCCGAWCPRLPASLDGAPLTGYACQVCRTALMPIGSPLCLCCGRPFDSDQGMDHVCGQCQADHLAFEEARAAARYSESLRSLIRHFKYRGCEPLAKPLGQLLWEALWRYWHLDDFDRIVPVPLHRRRRRQRGFNQAALLLRSWPRLAARSGMDLDRDRIVCHALVRHRHTVHQAGLDRKARQANMRQAFKLGIADVAGRRILLVDDVYTTGATAHACAQVLVRGGAKNVKVLTLARADH